MTADPAPLIATVLQAFGLEHARSIQALGGTATPKWAVTTRTGRYVVRIRPTQFAGPDCVSFDHAVLLRLAAGGLPVPRPLVTTAGETVLRRNGLVIEVLTWIEGAPWADGDPAALRGVGTFLARFHAIGAGDFPAGKQDQRREDHPDALQPGLDALRERTTDPGQRRQLDAIDDLLARGRRELEASLYASLPRAVIHGDFHPGNVRFRGPAVAALYDFDYLAVQARARDVVDALMFFASRRSAPFEPDLIRSLTQPFVPDLAAAQAVLAGYQAISPLTAGEWQALPLLLRSRWIQMRLRGSRKVPPAEQSGFVLADFFTVPDWLEGPGRDFFSRLHET